jgi:hypothetical protein
MREHRPKHIDLVTVVALCLMTWCERHVATCLSS